MLWQGIFLAFSRSRSHLKVPMYYLLIMYIVTFNQ